MGGKNHVGSPGDFARRNHSSEPNKRENFFIMKRKWALMLAEAGASYKKFRREIQPRKEDFESMVVKARCEKAREGKSTRNRHRPSRAHQKELKKGDSNPQEREGNLERGQDVLWPICRKVDYYS